MRKLLTVIVIGCVLALGTACSTSWISEAQAIIAVLIPAADGVLEFSALQDGKTVSAQDLQTISNYANQANSDFGLLGSLISQYQGKPTADTLSKIDAAFSVAQSNLNALLPALHIVDKATIAKLTAEVNLIGSELASMQALIPIIKGQSVPVASAKCAARLVSINNIKPSAPPMTAKQFKKAFNAIMARNSPVKVGLIP